MEKVIKVIDSQILKTENEISQLKSVINDEIKDYASYAAAFKKIGPKIENLEKLNKIKKLIQSFDNQTVEKPVSKRGRPKKVKCN